MTHYLIYKITNLVNGKFYIGKHITDNIEDNYFGSGINVKRAIQKHGIENFVFNILIDLKNEEEMNLLEELVVNEDFVKRPDTYNMKVGGVGGWGSGENSPWFGKTPWNKGKHHTEETKVKLSKAFSGEKNPMYGHVWTEEEKEKQRLSHIGQKAWNKGIPMSEEAKKKLSINSGSRRQEVREKNSAAHKGKKLSEAHKQKDREAIIGMLFWNNGIICKRNRECPGPEWKPGRLKNKKLGD